MAILALLTITSLSEAQRISPESVKVKAGELAVINVVSKGDVAFFYDAREFGPKNSLTVGKTLILTTGKKGSYSISVISWDDKKIEQVLVEVEGGAGPDPIDPPSPAPSELMKKLQTAWALESAEDKAKVKGYQQMYSDLSAILKGPSVLKIADLWAELGKARAVRLGDTPSKRYLEQVGFVFGDDLNASIPKTLETVIDDGMRKLLVLRFRTYAAALGELR